nr:hypothetical protein RTCK_02234 [Rhizobium sp. TCK]
MFLRAGAVALFVLGLPGGSAFADQLPKEAVRLTSAEVKAIYAGKTTNWPSSNGYFAPDGSFLQVEKKGSWVAEGKWRVQENEMCVDSTMRDFKGGELKKSTNCWTWYKHGKRYLTRWSGDKGGDNAYWDGAIKTLSSEGDMVPKKYKKLVASN